MDPQLDEEENELDQPSAWGDVHGGTLPIKDVQEARMEEVQYMQSHGIWKVVPISKYWESTGKNPVSVR